MEISFQNKARKMVAEIAADMRATRHLLPKDRLSDRVTQAMIEVPRHEFVPPHMRAYAYANEPLPIGSDQTISQPYIVALMTDLLEPQPEHVVLEVGTGSGYQAAVLAQLVKTVYSIETIPELGAAAAERLQRLGYDNVVTRIGDAWHGWPEAAPFDAIIVTAAAPEIPPPLVEQLRPGGRMVIPVGSRFGQKLVLVTKDENGQITPTDILPVAFVPLTGQH